MEDSSRNGLHDFNLASRKAEESAIRRFQAAGWLESVVGPLGISSQPSEREFISCLRSGLILCNAINKIHPGAVPKVVENNWQSLTREFQPPPAYQYFENVKNFLVAVEELKLPAFEASDLERDTLESGSVGKVVDCILGLKSYYEWNQMNRVNGFHKHTRSPMVLHSASRTYQRSTSDSCRRLDMSTVNDKQPPVVGLQKLEDALVKAVAEHMEDTKENIDENALLSLQNGDLDSIKLFKHIISSLIDKQLQPQFPEVKSVFWDLSSENGKSPVHLTSMPPGDSVVVKNSQCCRACLKNDYCKHKHLLQTQEKELSDLKALLTRTKNEFKYLHYQLQRDLKDLGNQVQEMSTAALGYHKVVKENRKLHNMVQDLKGNIRVYCRIRPTFNREARNVIEFIGESGSLVVLDPSKPHKDGRKVFQFNHVFGPTATQDEVFRDTQPLIRSVMDGYNVCIFAYGQTGSGKTYTMSGPSGGSSKDLGINYLALNDLFLLCDKRKGIINYNIHVQMVEIYNEQVRDLLAEDSSTTKLEIRSCVSENGLSLPDATMRSVNSTTDVLKLMKLGEVNRVVSSTAVNNRSSRSHSVLTVHVHGKDTSGGIIRSCLHLVDLAGSERVDKSEVTGARLKEAQYINKSLSCLGDVITALAQKNSHIPYRNSKLTLLLQDSLGGHAKTLMFAHLSPEEDSFGETLSTLKFAQRVSTVELGAARANKESSEVMQLKEQIESLKKALANKEAPNAFYGRSKELRSPRNVTEKTPPRARRLSIENGSTTKTEQVMNPEIRKGVKSPLPSRPRRLSLEGPKSTQKDDIPVNASDAVRKPMPIEAVPFPGANLSNGNSRMDVYHAPRSPISSYQRQVIKRDGRTQIPHLQLPKTPEKQILARNEVQNVMQNEITLSTGSRTNGKGSQIRKSLRNIGKLINGSEKRNQQNSVEAGSPIKGASNINDGKSPLTANARALRRQSLTGIQASGSDMSRRTSLGGKSVDSGANDSRNAKTPPPVHPSAKTTKRWL